ncbi:MAG: hypothetical protein IPN34_21740 [Planctomycetes bacterium]|nr:hypothetical protein [Planctomycetota bacterium]
MSPLSSRSRAAYLGCAVGFALLSSASAQIPRRVRAVPTGGILTQAASALCQDENFLFVGQTAEGLPGVSYRIGEENGSSWTAAQSKLVDPASQGLDPTVVIVNEEVFLCWVERRSTPTGNVDAMWFDVSPNEGETWNGIRPMNPPSFTGTRTLERYVVAADPGARSRRLVVATLTRDVATGARELLLHRSTNLGASFAAPLAVSTSAASTSAIPSFDVELSETAAHVAWLEERPSSGAGRVELFQRSIAHASGGFGAERLVSSGSFAPSAESIDLAVDGDALAVAWLEAQPAGREALFFASSLDAGASFAAPREVGGANSTASSPELAVDRAAGEALLAWSETRGSSARVLARRAPLAGGALGAESEPFGPGVVAPRLVRGAPDTGRVLLTAVRPGAVLGSITEGASAAFRAPFELLALPNGESVRPAASAFYAFERDFVLSWVAGSGASTRQLVGGVRPQTVAIRGGAIQAGAPLVFDLFGFPADPSGVYSQVLLAFDEGTTIFPGLLPEVGLDFDALLLTSLQVPAWQGFLDANGRRSTPPIGVPLELRGQALWVAAVALNTRFELVVTDAREELVR